jgi:hypothetical protein
MISMLSRFSCSFNSAFLGNFGQFFDLFDVKTQAFGDTPAVIGICLKKQSGLAQL